MTGPSAYNIRKQPPPSLRKPKKNFLVQKQEAEKLSKQARWDIWASGFKANTYAIRTSAPVVEQKARPSTPDETPMRNPFKIPEYPEAAWEAAKECVKKAAERTGSLHSYGAVYEKGNGEYGFWNSGGPCYGGLSQLDTGQYSSYVGKRKKKPFFIDWGLPLWWRPDEPKKNVRVYTGMSNLGYPVSWEDALVWVNFIANKSVWKYPYVEKDPEAILSGPIIFHTCFPYRYMLQASMLPRFIYEKPYCIRTWIEFNKHIKGSAAFFLAQRFEYFPEKKVVKYRYDNWHTIFDNSCDDPVVLKSLWNRDFSHMKGQTLAYNEFGSYYHLCSTWMSEDGHRTELKLPPPTSGMIRHGFGSGDTREWDCSDMEKFLKEVLKLNGIGEKNAKS